MFTTKKEKKLRTHWLIALCIFFTISLISLTMGYMHGMSKVSNTLIQEWNVLYALLYVLLAGLVIGLPLFLSIRFCHIKKRGKEILMGLMIYIAISKLVVLSGLGPLDSEFGMAVAELLGWATGLVPAVYLFVTSLKLFKITMNNECECTQELQKAS